MDTAFSSNHVVDQEQEKEGALARGRKGVCETEEKMIELQSGMVRAGTVTDGAWNLRIANGILGSVESSVRGVLELVWEREDQRLMCLKSTSVVVERVVGEVQVKFLDRGGLDVAERKELNEWCDAIIGMVACVGERGKMAIECVDQEDPKQGEEGLCYIVWVVVALLFCH